MNCELVLKFLATTCLQKKQALASSISAYNHSTEVIDANRSQYHYLLNGQVSQVDRRSSESGIRSGKICKEKVKSTRPSWTVLGSGDGEADGWVHMSLETK
jgi:hypothetical protein